ncbi:serine protein kinase PrkA, partial [Myxococcota bacterium]|nr:serine protein kinase PrkA [Myxococcota bacterium]
KFVVSDYLRSGDLCQKCRSVYDTLLTSYEGDAAQVLEHVQVNRFYLSRRYRRAIATIEPQASVDARIQQVTADRTLTALPKALQQVSLFEPTGPLVAANRGLLEFSDLFKRPVEAFKYLLDTIETGTVALDSFVLHLDMIFLASTNDTYLEAFKEHPDFPSFKGRIELIKVPYLLRFEDEKEIYARQTTERSVGRHIAPHALDVAALWAVLTRLRRNEASNYSKEFKAVIEKLTPLDKSHLFDTGKVPDGLSNRDAKELHHRVEELFLEGRSFSKYEGKMGASARELRTALLNAAHNPDYQCLSPLAVFEQIREILENRSVFPYLRQEASHGFHEHKKFLEQVEDVYLGWVDDEIRMSMGLAAEESYAQLFARYVRHASHWLKKEKIQDPVSGNFIKADEKFMEEIEAVLKGEKEAAKDFRAEVIGTIGAHALENPDSEPNYSEIFGAYIEKLREDYFAQRREQIGRINKNFLLYTAHDRKSLEPKELEHLEKMLGRLKERFGYCENCARDTVAYLVKKRYQ